MRKVVYEPGTGTIIGLDNAVIIEMPDDVQELEDMEEYCAQNLSVERRAVEVDYAPIAG